jgi:hypothetical protein
MCWSSLHYRMDVEHWPHRPSGPDDETELQCLRCGVFKAWFCYSQFCPLKAGEVTFATFKDLGGHRWACDDCVKDNMLASRLWTVQPQ